MEDQDAMGHMLLAQLENGGAPEVLEREDGFISVTQGAQRYFTPHDRWSAIEKRSMRFARGRVLDVGCGAGRHCLYLQDKGLEVVGIDSSPLAVEVCRRRGVRDVRRATLASLSPRRFGHFDTILMLGHNFGLVGDIEKGRHLLGRLGALTTAEGRIIASTRDPYVTLTHAHLRYQETNRQRGRSGGQIRMRLRHAEYKSRWFDYLYVSKSELRELLDGTGWNIAKLLDSGESDYIPILENTNPKH